MQSRKSLEFVKVKSPITEPVTKFGGQPVWIDGAQWPLSRQTGNPMRFICQIALDSEVFPEAFGKMAYVFMTDEEEYVDGTWSPESGENAIVIQPNAQLNPKLEYSSLTSGPTLYQQLSRAGHAKLETVDCEFRVYSFLQEDPDFSCEDERSEWTESELSQYISALEGNKVGGTPWFLQNDQFPEEGKWRLLLQLDSAQVPFSINFGDAGIAYAFIDQEGREGKFLWQCC